ncbi:MAG: single-stranded DNA-binding protein [Patescibacteria group bacterium]|jgi:single-strand DNA-binding protein
MSMSLNRATIIGNLTRDPEMRTTTSGQSVVNFSVATSSQWTDAAGQRQERTEYHPIVAWGKLAEICHQYLGKGRKVYIEGRLQTREWETPDAQKRQRTEIVADNMIMLDKAGQGGAVAPTTVRTPDDSPVPQVEPGVGDQEIRIEDIPF